MSFEISIKMYIFNLNLIFLLIQIFIVLTKTYFLIANIFFKQKSMTILKTSFNKTY
jgi:hypothetical protein